ncbi:hypothetical protein BLNAU_6141 [Blattamonas nauphoetae]|uniref:Uncharacterized protein n=1 Tax=Blattamonas nauphoetae TaxID=2049346 RepID=A0ABQ9Y567_9EUKA|nr:hypothetical protein BLNAU_6141 [Blattamonas nauphoetae]
MVHPHKSSFQSIVLDDPSFPDLVIQSLQLNNQDIRYYLIDALINISRTFLGMKKRFCSHDLVRRMFESVDFVSLPLSDTQIHVELTQFITLMVAPIEEDAEQYFNQLQFLRVTVFEPATQYIIFIFRNLDRLSLEDKDQDRLEISLCRLHRHLNNMELHSDEHDVEVVPELVKWEVRQMVEMEDEDHFEEVFESVANRTEEWKRWKRERQKRREVLLREVGLDDAFELRVVGIEKDAPRNVKKIASKLRVLSSFNSDEG